MGTTTAKSKKNKQKTKLRAPRRVRDAVESILASDDAPASEFLVWRDYLRERRQDPPLQLIQWEKAHPLVWALSELVSSPDDQRKLARQIKSQVTPAAAEEWLQTSESASKQPAVDNAIQHLVWASRLPSAVEKIGSENWMALLHRLLDVATDELKAAESNLESWLEDHPLERQLLGPELAIWLAYLFPEIPACAELATPAFETMSAAVVEMMDGEGMTEAKHLKIVRALAASWTRVQWIGRSKGKKSWRLNKAARRDFDWMIRQLLRWTRPKLASMFGEPDSTFEELIVSAVALTGDEEDHSLVDLIIHGKRVSDDRLPESPSYHGEWAEAAILRPDWSPQGPVFALTYDNSRLHTELVHHGQRLVSGEWNTSLRLNGQPIEQVSEWDTTCWFSDFDVDFLELEADFEGGWSIQRQFLMARQDLFLWTADVLTGPSEELIELQTRVPLDAAVRCTQSDQHRDFAIVGRRKLAHVLPVGLPEWCSDQSQGELIVDDRTLTVVQRQRGTGICLPLFFDLHSDRNKNDITWRQLTVAENLEIVGGDTAVGYRVQSGREQWLWYRALKMPGCRTVLGQNYSSEFVCTRFLKDGDTDDLVSID